MGHPETNYCLTEVRGLTRETGIAILDKAADIGLLTAHGGGYYTIHPALPWFFRALFEWEYPTTDDRPQTTGDGSTVNRPSSIVALRAYVESMGELGNYYHIQYEYGNRDVIASLRREEPNLLHARSLARQHGWWMAIISAMQGLYQLYNHTGRRAEWKRLVEEIVPDFVGADDLPLSGREEQWGLVTEYQVRLAMESHAWADAERLQRMRVEWERRRAMSLLARPAESLSTGEKNTLRTLGASLHLLGEIQREIDQPDCVMSFQETFEIMQRIGGVSAAVAAYNLGRAFTELPTLRNLDEAERWYRRSLELRAEGDRKGKGGCMAQLGSVAYEHFKDAKKEGKAEEELLKYLNVAVDYYQQALALLPPDDVNALAVAHNQLGIIYAEAGNIERATSHWNQSVNYKEAAGNIYAAGTTRFNIAVLFFQNGRLSDALLYAKSALRNFESYGGRAKEMEDRAMGLIAEIEEAMKG